MTNILKEVSKRVGEIIRTGAPLETVAKKVNVEFHVTAYVNKGKLWGRYKDDSGAPQVRVLA